MTHFVSKMTKYLKSVMIWFAYFPNRIYTTEIKVLTKNLSTFQLYLFFIQKNYINEPVRIHIHYGNTIKNNSQYLKILISVKKPYMNNCSKMHCNKLQLYNYYLKAYNCFHRE